MGEYREDAVLWPFFHLVAWNAGMMARAPWGMRLKSCAEGGRAKR